MSPLSDTVDQAITSSGRSLRSIAEAAGLSATHLHDVRYDRRGLSVEVAQRLAQVLAIDERTLVLFAQERALKTFLELNKMVCPCCGWPKEKR